MSLYPIASDLAQAPTQGINIESSATSNNASAKTASDRASKISELLGDNSPGIDVLADQITQGQEGSIRDGLASEASAKRQKDLIQGVLAQAQEGNFPTMDNLSTLSFTPANPDTILEELYADKAVNKTVAAQSDPRGILRQAMEKDEKATLQKVQTTKEVVSRNEIATTLAQDINDQWENTSWFSGDGVQGVAGNIIPMYNWSVLLQLRNQPDSQNDGFLPGEILRQKAQELYSITDPLAFKQKMKDEIALLSKESIPVAVQYAQAMVSYSTSSEFLDSAFALADTADVVTGVGGALKAGRAAAKAAVVSADGAKAVDRALKDFVQSKVGLEINTADALSGAGDVAGASKTLLRQSIDTFVQGAEGVDTLPMRQKIPSIFNPDVLAVNPASSAIERSDRLGVLLRANSSKLLDVLTETATVPRVASNDALEAAVLEAESKITQTYKQAVDGLIDFRTITPDQNVANVGQVRALFGKNDATPFNSQREAIYWMENEYHIPDTNYRVVMENGKWYGVVDQYLTETSDFVRDNLIDTNSTTPRSFIGQLVGFTKHLRGGNELVSKTDMGARQLATSASEKLKETLAEIGSENIGSLGATKTKRLERLLEIDRAFVDDKGNQGRFLSNLQEYEAQYKSVFGEAPSEAESAAYFTAVQLNDFDYMVRDMGLLRDLARDGVENFKFSIFTPEAGTVMTPTFKARKVDSLPGYDEKYTVLVYDSDGKPTTLFSHDITTSQKAQIEDMMSRGYKVAEIDEPNIKPLRSVTGTDGVVNFVLAKEFQTSKLGFGNLNYQPGGHREYVSKHFVKSPKVSDYLDNGRKVYEGDAVAFAFETKAEATKYAARMDEARRLMNAGDAQALDNYLAANLPFTAQKFKALFQETTDEAGNIIARRFDPQQSFRYVENGNNIHSMYGLQEQGVESLADTKFNRAAERDRRFLSGRDPELWTIREAQRDGGVVHSLQGAKQLDPLASITRTMRSVMEARVMNDYKIGAIDRWISEFGQTMNVSKEDLRRNPAYYFNNPEFNEGYKDKKFLAAAKASQMNIRNFLGTEDQIQKQVNFVTQAMLDGVYNVAGQRVSNYTAEQLAKISDPSRFFRGMAFHVNMGFFNPLQIAVQGQTAFVISAISPKHGPAATMYGIAQQLTAYTRNEGVLRKMESFLDSVGLNGKIYRESSEELRRTGFDIVGGETMWSEGTLSPKVFSSKMGKALDAGTVFFKGTERMLRLSGWHTAFSEWRELNPTKAITAMDRAQILNRAQSLTVNMTSASRANWEKGILSVPTQFMGYQARLMDLVIGQQLSVGEKARLLGLNAILYGLPGAGAAATGYSAYDAMRTYALDNGLDLTDPMLSTIIEGVPHMVAQQMGLGEWNYSSRYGPSGFTALQDLIEGDKTLIQTLGGPSGSIFIDNAKRLAPAITTLTEVLRGDGSNAVLLPQDFIDAARGIGTANSLVNLVMAASAGKYYSKNNVYTADLNWQQAMIMGITGLQPSEIPDTYLMIKNKKSWDELRKVTDAQFINNYQRGILAATEDNRDLFEAYMRRAGTFYEAGHYNPQEKAALLQKALKNQGSLVHKVREDFWQKAPAELRGPRLQRILEKAN